jgi:hypothetical protein
MSLGLQAAMGIFLAIMAGGAANAGPNGKDVPRVAFLGFEFINTSLEATAPVEVERIRLLDDVMRQKLTASSNFYGDKLPPPQMIDSHLPPPVRGRQRILPKMACRGQEVCGLIRGAPGGPRNVSSWHTASNRCGAKVRTRSERSGHAESVGSGSI